MPHVTASAERSRIRVAHVITNLTTGGAETALERLVCALDRQRFECHVYSLLVVAEIGARIRAAGIPVTALNMGERPWSIATGFLRLRKELRAFQPDLVQGWMYHGNTVATLAAAALPGVPVLWNVRASLGGAVIQRRRTKVLVRASRWLAHRPVRIVNNSWESAHAHRAVGYSPSQTVIIPNGFDTRRFKPSSEHRQQVREQLGVSDACPLIGVIGRYHPVKGHDVFVEAMLQVMRANEHAHAVLVGPGFDTERSLRARVQAAGLYDRFHFQGARNDIERVLAALDVYCQASFSEGFPNALAEALCCGIPCVATDVGDSRRVLGESGILVNVRDARALADGIEQLLQLQPEQRIALGLKGRERVSREFSLPAVVRSYENCYEECLTRGVQVQVCR